MSSVLKKNTSVFSTSIGSPNAMMQAAAGYGASARFTINRNTKY